MSKGYGKVQVLILDTLEQALHEDGYWYSMRELMEETGKSQQSIHRAISGLISDGLVQMEWDKYDGSYERLPQRYAKYMLVAKQDEHDAMVAAYSAGAADRAIAAEANFQRLFT